MEQNGYPIRVVYRGTQVVFRYQMPAAIPMPRGVAVVRYGIQDVLISTRHMTGRIRR